MDFLLLHPDEMLKTRARRYITATGGIGKIAGQFGSNRP
jgi:hypothetical protein